MSDYKYKISLKLLHPLMHPSEITAIFGIDPDITHVAGEQRKTPRGNQLQGFYKECYWFANLLERSYQTSDDLPMENHLFQVTNKLSLHKAFFKSLSSSGGRAYIDVATDCRTNYELIYLLNYYKR